MQESKVQVVIWRAETSAMEHGPYCLDPQPTLVLEVDTPLLAHRLGRLLAKDLDAIDDGNHFYQLISTPSEVTPCES